MSELPVSPTRDWDPLPRSLEEIREWYRASQPKGAYHPAPRELPARVVHQIQKSLQDGLPLYPKQVKRLIEYADRLNEERP